MTTVIINPGSRISDPPNAEEWTNSYPGALNEAKRWLENMHKDVSPDIELAEVDETEREGRWRFVFRHTVTGATATLETHGINNIGAYLKRHFSPKVYWKGSSCSDPKLADFAAPGYVMTFRENGDGR